MRRIQFIVSEQIIPDALGFPDDCYIENIETYNDDFVFTVIIEDNNDEPVNTDPIICIPRITRNSMFSIDWNIR
jgi:hypothetical protein